MNSESPSVAVVTDSTSDIPLNEADALNINIVPAVLTLDGQSYIDGEDISRAEFYRRLPTLSQPPTSAAPSPLAFENIYQKIVDLGVNRILSIHVSHRLSAMIDVATHAAKSFGDRVHIFDSGQVSLGLGFQVMEAATAALSYKSFEAVLEAAKAARRKVRLVALIDTLEYLKRSGRVSWMQAGIGNLLNIKLLVGLVDGVVERLGQVRTRKKGIKELLSLVESWETLERLAVLHSAIPEEASALANQIRHLSSKPPLIVDVTTVLGTHVGPAAIGLAGLCK